MNCYSGSNKLTSLIVLIAFLTTSTLSYANIETGHDTVAALRFNNMTDIRALPVAASGTLRIAGIEESSRSELRNEYYLKLVEYAAEGRWTDFEHWFNNVFVGGEWMYKPADQYKIDEAAVLDFFKVHPDQELITSSINAILRRQPKTLSPSFVASISTYPNINANWTRSYYSPEALEEVKKILSHSNDAERFMNAVYLVGEWPVASDIAVDLLLFIWNRTDQMKLNLSKHAWASFFTSLGKFGANYRDKVEPILNEGLHFRSQETRAAALSSLVSLGWYPKLSESALSTSLSDLFSSLAETYVQSGKGENIIQEIYRAMEWPWHGDVIELMATPNDKAAETLVKNNANFPVYYYEDIQSRSVNERKRMATEARDTDLKILRTIWMLRKTAEKLAAANFNERDRLLAAQRLYQGALAVLDRYRKEISSFGYEEAHGGDRNALYEEQVRYSMPMFNTLAKKRLELIGDLAKLELKMAGTDSFKELLKILFQYNKDDKNALWEIFFELSAEAVKDADDEIESRIMLAEISNYSDVRIRPLMEFLAKNIDHYDDQHIRLFVESMLRFGWHHLDHDGSFSDFSSQVKELPDVARKRIEKVLLELLATKNTVPEFSNLKPFDEYAESPESIVYIRESGIHAGLKEVVDEIESQLFELLKDQDKIVINRVLKLLSAEQLTEVLLSGTASLLSKKMAARALGKISDVDFLISKLREHPQLAAWIPQSLEAAASHEINGRGTLYYEKTKVIEQWLAYGLNDSEPLVQNAILPALLDVIDIPAFYNFFQEKIQNDQGGKIRALIETKIQAAKKKKPNAQYYPRLFLLQHLINQVPAAESDASVAINTDYYFSRILYMLLEPNHSPEVRNRIREILIEIRDNKKIPRKKILDLEGSWPDRDFSSSDFTPNYFTLKFDRWEETTNGLAAKFLDRWDEISEHVGLKAADHLIGGHSDIVKFKDIGTIHFFLSKVNVFDDSLRISIEGKMYDFHSGLSILKPIADANPSLRAQLSVHSVLRDTYLIVSIDRSELRANLGDLVKVRSQTAINRMRDLFKDVEPFLEKYATGQSSYPSGTPNPQMASALKELVDLVDQGKVRPSFTELVEKVQAGTLSPTSGSPDRVLVATSLKDLKEYISSLRSELRSVAIGEIVEKALASVNLQKEIDNRGGQDPRAQRHFKRARTFVEGQIRILELGLDSDSLDRLLRSFEHRISMDSSLAQSVLNNYVGMAREALKRVEAVLREPVSSGTEIPSFESMSIADILTDRHSIRIMNSLASLNVQTVADLLRIPVEELRRARGFRSSHSVSLRVLLQALSDVGISIRNMQWKITPRSEPSAQSELRTTRPENPVDFQAESLQRAARVSSELRVEVTSIDVDRSIVREVYTNGAIREGVEDAVRKSYPGINQTLDSTTDNVFRTEAVVSGHSFPMVIEREGDNEFQFSLIATTANANVAPHVLSPEEVAAFGELEATELVEPVAKANLQKAVSGALPEAFTKQAEIVNAMTQAQLFNLADPSANVGLVAMRGFVFGEDGSPYLLPSLFAESDIVFVQVANLADSAALPPIRAELRKGQELIEVRNLNQARAELRKRGLSAKLLATTDDLVPSSVKAWAQVQVFSRTEMRQLTAAIEKITAEFRSELRIASAA